MNTAIWWVLYTAIIAFCLWRGYSMGYKAGAKRVLKEWKKTLHESGDGYNE